jgi:hypothetical protein
MRARYLLPKAKKIPKPLCNTILKIEKITKIIHKKEVISF